MSSRPCEAAPGRPLRRPEAAGAVVLLTILALALPACGSFSSSEAEDRPSTVSQPAEPEAAEAASEATADPTPEPAEPLEAEAPGTTQTTALPPEPTAPEPALPAEPVIDDDPARLIGLGPASLSALLGAPQLIRREAPAALWQYQAEGCVLDVVLYPDNGADRVTYLEAREDGLTKIPPRQCLGKLLRVRRGLPAG